jgi:heat shock protein HslJ
MKITTLLFLTLISLYTDKQSVKTLTDTEWALIKITNLRTNQIQLADTSCKTTLHFESDGRYKGYSGCNNYNGKYSTINISEITMDNPCRTKRGCHPPCDLGETLFGHYPKATTYLMQEDTLVLWTIDSVKITFQKK